MKRYIFLSSLLALACNVGPGIAQNSSNCRVIYGSNGLAYPSSSYITPGTLSKTAQEGAGCAPQAQTNPGLPKVNHGAYLGTPGDNLYSGNPDLSQHPQPVYTRRSNRIIYKQPLQSPPPKVYTPDANIPMSYSDYKNDLPAQESSIKDNNVNIDNKNTLPIQQ